MRRCWWSLMLAITVVAAAEYPLPNEPLSVQRVEQTRPDGTVIASYTSVDWGVAGTARRRRPERIENEFAEFSAWMGSPEVAHALREVSQEADLQVQDVVRARMIDLALRYRTTPRNPTQPWSRTQHEDRQPTPEAYYPIPAVARSIMRLVVFDDRDQRQRDLAEREVAQDQVDGKQTQLLCVGWNSSYERDMYWRALTPGGAFPIGTEDFARFWQIESLPARIWFEDEGLTVVKKEGLPPELAEERPRQNPRSTAGTLQNQGQPASGATTPAELDRLIKAGNLDMDKLNELMRLLGPNYGKPEPAPPAGSP